MRATALLDLGFFVDDVLTHDRVVFLKLKLSRGGALVFGGGVVVASAGARYELDFVAHELPFLFRLVDGLLGPSAFSLYLRALGS